MLTKDWENMVKTRESVIVENDLIVSPDEYRKLQKHMEVQDILYDVHILSMNYTVSTGELKIKRRYFKQW